MTQSNVDPYDLQRFVDAQSNGVFERALAELKCGEKQTHWMWFIFPQIAGLGASAMSQRYAIASLDEAKAYMAHPLLGPRLRNATRIVNQVDGRDIAGILGTIDAMKFHSSLTLFAQATTDNGVLRAALEKYFSGVPDAATLARLR